MYACLYCLKHFAAADYVGEKGALMDTFLFVWFCVLRPNTC